MTKQETNETEERPEWIRATAAKKIFGLSRSYLYELKDNGKIKSRSLKKPGAIQGVRLFNYDSIKAFIEGSEEGKGKNAVELEEAI